MVPSVWAITGIKLETFDRKGKDKLLPDAVTGRLHKATNTIMQGGTWVDEAHSIGYAYLKVSLQKMEDFDSLPLAERGLGAVSGGYILSSNDTWSEPVKTEQKWGVVDSSKAIFVCSFYSKGKRYSRVMVCFDRANAAPVSGFWRNGKVLVGPNIQCDQTDWGRDLHSGSHAIALEKAKRTVVLRVEAPKLLADGATTTVKPEVMFSQVFTNRSSAAVKDNFNMKTQLLDTHTFVFEEGLEVDWSEGSMAKVPLLLEAQTPAAPQVSFGANQFVVTTNVQTIDRSAEISLPPKTGVKATARYVKRVVTFDATLTVQTTYTNGAIQTRVVPANVTGVSCDLAEIKLEDIPVAR